MPTKGQIITNAINGNSYEFMETSKDTGGAFVTMKATINQKGKLVPDHFHTLQDETFEVVSGQMTILSEGTTIILNAGDKISLPRNMPHNHFNESDAPLVYIHTVTPALDFEYLIENMIGLVGDGKSIDGKLSLVQQLVTLKYLDSKSFLVDMPLGVQKFLMNTVAPVARLLGYRAVYKKYSGFEK